MGSQKKEVILQAKWAVDFVKKAKMGKEWDLSFVLPAKLLLVTKSYFHFQSTSYRK